MLSTSTVDVNFTTYTVNATHSTVTSSSSSIAADGAATSTITVTLKDVRDGLKSDLPVTLTANAGMSTISEASGLSDANGQVFFTVSNTKAESVTYTAVGDGVTLSTTVPVTFTAGSFSKLQILLPGETAAPGTENGKTGTPSAQTAGTAFDVTVNAVDDNWNKISSTNIIAITSSDVNAVLPSSAALVSGSNTYSIILNTSGTSTVTATNNTNGSISANTSPSTTINAGAINKLQILMPGEAAAPGTESGKTGMPTTRTAGTAFNVIVNAVDANWNIEFLSLIHI